MTESKDPAQISVDYETALEQLRQERETFELRKKHESSWFLLRLIMGYLSVFLLPSVAIFCGYIILNQAKFGTTIATLAAGALLTDIVALIIAVWKVVLQSGSIERLKPVTTRRKPQPKDAKLN